MHLGSHDCRSVTNDAHCAAEACLHGRLLCNFVSMLSSDTLLRLVVRWWPCRSPPPPPFYKTEVGRPTDGATPVGRALEKE